MAKPGSKKQSGKKIEILICGLICYITLHFRKKKTYEKICMLQPRTSYFLIIQHKINIFGGYQCVNMHFQETEWLFVYRTSFSLYFL